MALYGSRLITPVVDFGGTTIKLGVVVPNRIVASASLPARSEQPLAQRLGEIARALERLAAGVGPAWRDGGALGVAFPSIIEPRTGRPLDAYGKFADAPALDLHGWAMSALGLRLAIDNDARMALLGECIAGAGRGADDVVMMTLGTGVGTAVMTGGKLLRGRRGQAGILGGHCTTDLDGPECHCGNRGCAEMLASTAALPQLARSCPEFDQSLLSGEKIVDYRAVFAAADAGDALAGRLRDRAIRVWGATIVTIVHSYDPERVVVGGGIAAAGRWLIDALRTYVHRHAHTPWGKVDVVAAELGSASALIGAACFARERK